jgi:hypothetical protein
MYREMFIQEAKEVSNMLNGVHHTRKLSHLQINYPETVQRLSQLQTDRTMSLSSSQANLFPSQTLSTTLDPKDRVKEFKQTKLHEYQAAMKSHLVEERLINFRKKEYYREMGRKAVVNQVRIAIRFLHAQHSQNFLSLGYRWDCSSSERRIISAWCKS